MTSRFEPRFRILNLCFLSVVMSISHLSIVSCHFSLGFSGEALTGNGDFVMIVIFLPELLCMCIV